MNLKKVLIASFFGSSIASYTYAGACDYRPSNLAGAAVAGSVATAAAGTATAGVAAHAAGFYTLTHAVTGLTMLGSTAGGASAAGTVGIMGGTAGFVGSAAAVLMAPATIVAATVVGVGIAGYEGICYLTVEKMDDPAAVAEMVANIAANSDPRLIRLASVGGEEILMIASEFDDSDNPIDWKKYKVRKLYVEDGNLRHSDFGLNSNLGSVHWYQSAQTD